ncbi:MAG TPA: hypothetical protein VFX92_05590 [Candidatus Krumholzibacteria bacterium]|nr:hypothetical protein [Candidatus Krumholzibacteria bacterium]
MKHKCLVVGTLVLVVAGHGCDSAGEQRFRQEKRQFSIVMRSKLSQFDHKADALSAEVAGDSLQMADVEALRALKKGFDERIAIIDSASASEWKEIKPTLEAEYYDLERRFYEMASDAANRKASEAAADTLDTDATTGPAGTIAAPAGGETPETLRGK